MEDKNKLEDGMKKLLFFTTSAQMLDPVDENKVDIAAGIVRVKFSDGITDCIPMTSVSHWLEGSPEQIHKVFMEIKNSSGPKE